MKAPSTRSSSSKTPAARATGKARSQPPTEPAATAEATSAVAAETVAASEDPALAPADRGLKERVIHTRVPAVLEAELKRFAENLRVPVSNLIRTILEDAVAVADRAGQTVERELLTVAQRVGNERERMRGAVAKLDPLDGVYGFQPLILHVRAYCARCSTSLEPGAAAHLALSEAQGPRRFVCNNCVPGPTGGAPQTGDLP